MTLTPEELNDYIFPGSVLRLSNSNTFSVEPHYHIILNKNPLTDPDIVMVIASTNIEGRLRHAQKTGKAPSTLLIFENKDCSFLSEESIFDCNSPSAISLSALYDKYNCGEWTIKNKFSVSPEILEKFRNAVRLSAAAAYFKELL